MAEYSKQYWIQTFRLNAYFYNLFYYAHDKRGVIYAVKQYNIKIKVYRK